MVCLGNPEWNPRGRWKKKTMRKVSRSSHGVVQSDPNIYASMDPEEDYPAALAISNSSASASSSAILDPEASSPITMSPWNQPHRFNTLPNSGLLGSLVREQGHIYSLAMADDLLYTGSDSNNIRVWRNLEEFSGFKASSGLVKAIVISGKKIFTGHQDGRIRVWKVSPRNPGSYCRSGTLPTLKDIFKSYVEIRRRRTSLWIKHSDAISCMSLEQHMGLLYTSSWDRTFKVWRISDSKCLESVHAHDDAVNSVLAASHCLVYTGSADGTVKLWRREINQKSTKHLLLRQLLNQQCAVTTLAISHETTPSSSSSSILYCGSSDGLVKFWELKSEDFSEGGVLRGHKLAVLCLTTSGGLMLSGSADKSICVWRRLGCGVHSCVCVLSGHTGPVKCLVVKEEERRRWTVYSGSLDKSVKVWSVSVGEEESVGEPLWDSFHSRGS